MMARTRSADLPRVATRFAGETANCSWVNGTTRRRTPTWCLTGPAHRWPARGRCSSARWWRCEGRAKGPPTSTPPGTSPAATASRCARCPRPRRSPSSLGRQGPPTAASAECSSLLADGPVTGLEGRGASWPSGFGRLGLDVRAADARRAVPVPARGCTSRPRPRSSTAFRCRMTLRSPLSTPVILHSPHGRWTSWIGSAPMRWPPRSAAICASQGFQRCPPVGARLRWPTRLGLTTRQTEVLHLLDDGLTNAELAERLYLSVKTVDHHVSAILTKLEVTKRRDAVRRARELGLLS